MHPERLAVQYTGPKAAAYDNERIGTPDWEREHEVVASILRRIGGGNTLLDIPVGTGRFIELYKELGISATGMDVSSDMLALARRKAQHHQYEIKLEYNDIFRLTTTSEFDIVLSVRFFHWLEKSLHREALQTIGRLARRHLIIDIPHYVSPFETSSSIKNKMAHLIRHVKYKSSLRTPKFYDMFSLNQILSEFSLRCCEIHFCQDFAIGYHKSILLFSRS